MLGKVKVKCKFKKSPFCKIEYEITKSALEKNIANNGKYRCKLCAIHYTHLGKKSHFFKNFKIKHNFFKNIDNEIKAYLLGIIAGDGSVSDKKVSIVANSKDIETLELFKKYVAKNVLIRSKKRSNCSTISVISRKMASDICRHLMIAPGKKSDKIRLPKLNDELMIHFIRGLMDTDGCIDNPYTYKYTPRCFYSSTSKIILDEVADFFRKRGLSPYNSGIKLVFSGRDCISFLKEIYKDSNFSLSRKKHFFSIWETWKPFEGTIIFPSKRKIKRLKKLEGII